jgi:hypothetical protein
VHPIQGVAFQEPLTYGNLEDPERGNSRVHFVQQNCSALKRAFPITNAKRFAFDQFQEVERISKNQQEVACRETLRESDVNLTEQMDIPLDSKTDGKQ